LYGGNVDSIKKKRIYFSVEKEKRPETKYAESPPQRLFELRGKKLRETLQNTGEGGETRTQRSLCCTYNSGKDTHEEKKTAERGKGGSRDRGPAREKGYTLATRGDFWFPPYKEKRK